MRIFPEDLSMIYDFLDMIRDTGKTNMFSAGSYLVEHLDMNKREARKYMMAWFKRDENKQKLLGG